MDALQNHIPPLHLGAGCGNVAYITPNTLEKLLPQTSSKGPLSNVAFLSEPQATY